jgi:hypothetical protein
MNMYLKAFVEELDKEMKAIERLDKDMKAIEGCNYTAQWLGGARWIAGWAAGCAEGIENWIGGCDNCRHKEGKDDFNPLCRRCVRNPDLPDEYERG